jgi:hypothetical protein
MSTPAEDPNKLAPQKPDEGRGWPDAVALGIGCLVSVIMFVAIVLVALNRE